MASSFVTDDDKMYDFFNLTKEEFLKSYSYLSEADYEQTVKELNENTLANLMRSAENILIAQNSDYADEDEAHEKIDVTDYKFGIYQYAVKNLSKKQLENFDEICESMAC